MLKKLLPAAAVLAAVSANPVFAATPTFAVVNLPYIMNELPQTKALEESLAKEFAPRQAELEKLQSKGNALLKEIQEKKYSGKKLEEKEQEVAKLQAEFQKKLMAFQEDQRKMTADGQRQLQIDVQLAIDSIAKERGVDIVLRENGIVFIAEGSNLDISEEVIKRASKPAKKKD